MSEKRTPRARRVASGATIAGLGLAGAAIGFGIIAGSHRTNPQHKEAETLSANLYNSKDFPKGVPVPGILNGSVVLEDSRLGSTVTYKNPVILEKTNSSSNLKNLNGTWIGIAEDDTHGHAVIHPLQIQQGKNGSQTETVTLNDPTSPVLYGAAIYPTEVTNSGDRVNAFDITGNGNFSSVAVESIVKK